MNSIAVSVSGILLAAGQSKRFSSDLPKQLLDFKGKPMVRRMAQEALASRLCDLIVVLGYRADLMRPVLSDLGVKMVDNPDYAAGQSSSVKWGLRSLDPSATAALFIPADQPFLSSALIDRLITTYELSGGPIVLPTYRGCRGSPVLFDRSLFPELTIVTEDEGGKQIIRRHESEIVTVVLDSQRPLLDIDTLEDYWELMDSSGN